ncbi:MAG: endolytic transglycosylase MltG [Burkholderiales bacterium]|nr:endolytic transglycosylase MltG [Burkholderiales bacterium]MDE1927071.1 endolytic transglycosylase MltG [Burkholderiales bacterium]MDE2160813.1 endolytic transglycosylase MltG [Burkholderiales bacterium]MDE2501357.1 endolytic transglycosylase MltG [Burkholderiales bacterium]
MSRRSPGSRLWLSLAGVLVLIAAGAAVAAAWWLQQPLPLARKAVELSIESGTPPRQVAQAWVDAGVQVPPRLLYEWFRWSGQARRIRAGSYAIEVGATPRSLLAMMVQGDETLERIRITEGWTLRQLRAALAQAPDLQHASAGLSDAELMAAIGDPGEPAEGRFFPDTYSYSPGVSDLTVLKRAHAAMQRRLAQTWAERSPDVPLKGADEALILASIIEKETGQAADRGLVAGVFNNRLRIGMPLQTDPAVIYGLGSRYDGTLHKSDLALDTPYNTYLRTGLPPTPISLPGLASLRAAVRPASTRALYFVARGDGSSEFSASLADHNRAVSKYQRGR